MKWLNSKLNEWLKIDRRVYPIFNAPLYLNFEETPRDHDPRYSKFSITSILADTELIPGRLGDFSNSSANMVQASNGMYRIKYNITGTIEKL